MSYHIKEAYYTLQGEGHHTGRAAVFCRFAGCNLWSGIEEDRDKAVCKFCDTDFVGTDGPNGGHFDTAEDLALHLSNLWEGDHETIFVVCTGGEPLLQVDADLITALHRKNIEIAVETNGTIKPPDGIDWICVSPKADSEFVVLKGNELKLVFPQEGCEPDKFENMDFDHFYLQPMDGKNLAENIEGAVKYCLSNPGWKLSLQTHKLINIP
jgi:7-carboxy-7-deazaguanine synthase (Cx14CxxC type)